MSSPVLILLAILAGAAYAFWPDFQKYLRSKTTEESAPADVITPTEIEPPPAEEDVLAVRLHRLSQEMEPYARDASHPKELASYPPFRRAVEYFTDKDMLVSDVADYAFGQSWLLSCAALAALRQRQDADIVAVRVPDRIDGMSVWQMQFALEFLAHVKPRPPAGAVFIGFRDWWTENNTLFHAFADYFAAFDPDDPAELGSSVEALPAATRLSIAAFLRNVRNPMAGKLIAKLGVPGGNTAGVEVSAFLNSLGRFWNTDEDSSSLLEPEIWDDAFATCERGLERRPARLLLVSGEPLVGKTSFLKLLGKRVAGKGWRVFQASGADLQAGQVYIGQLEQRIREALTELDIERKIIWYIPDLMALAMSGTHQSQSASILDQMLPAIASGRVMLWSEATPAQTARLQQLRPALRRSLEVLRLESMDDDEAAAFAKRVGAKIEQTSGIAIGQDFSDVAVDVARHYLSSVVLPGSALSLMRTTAQRSDKTKIKKLTGHDILETLAQFTGLPLSILDGAERLSLDTIREFLAARVIGQPEAVEAIVERIAMLKSGLNDPGKPIGIFLFAGPTGTGKTELAKSAAEYLFGSADRMIRLDMSEYQSHDATAKILGGPALPPDAETLIARIRKQPFSLVLLDEFEKAHPAIWDLFLQVFDDGRLSDSTGQVADFRHCLIFLTTNLGATAHRDSGIGFRPSTSGFTNDQVLKAVGQTFRPEFQNRLDKVIVFRPLTRELMRKILGKELNRIFERRGLKDRDWAVEWDATALEFLLEKGFTPDMGARPLKRAIEQYVIAPLAATIVERRFPEGDQFVFVRRDGDALRADFVDPDDEDGTPYDPKAKEQSARANGIDISEERRSLGEMMRAPACSSGEILSLEEAREPIAERLHSQEWAKLKAELTKTINAPEFWTDKNRFGTLARLELMDRIEVAADTAASLQLRLPKAGDHSGKAMQDLISRLATQIYVVKEGLKDFDEKAPVEAALIVEAAFAAGADDHDDVRAWCNEVSSMYSRWADARNMRSSKLEGIEGLSSPALLVAGFGAYRTLARETGLHILENPDGSRVTAQVRVEIVPLEKTSKAEIRKSLAQAFGGSQKLANIVRRYRRLPSPLVRNADGSWRSGKVDEVLRGNFDILAHEAH